jgi:hypothetical protein
MIYTVTVKSITHYSYRKLDAIYKHVTFKYKDRARFRELTEKQFAAMKKQGNKMVEI